jgi:hypothetical protein
MTAGVTEAPIPDEPSMSLGVTEAPIPDDGEDCGVNDVEENEEDGDEEDAGDLAYPL